MRKFLAESANKGEQGKELAPTTNDAEEKDDGFPTPDGCLMIFRGSMAYDQSNYRIETLTFDVVGFPRTFHAILGRPCYAKFMAVPNYTYLKLKMLGPNRVITIGTSFQQAYECKVECCGHATAIVASRELAALREEVVEEVLDAKKSTGSFESAESSKDVLIDPSNFEGKTVHIGTMLSSE
ncbi:uncharacterized protein [Miscanthus floridulus]|uniref:uncharacterized protein n=1 Tax=Miscanthus floridulus TaxID=154761 RepID=UPI00345B1842